MKITLSGYQQKAALDEGEQQARSIELTSFSQVIPREPALGKAALPLPPATKFVTIKLDKVVASVKLTDLAAALSAFDFQT